LIYEGKAIAAVSLCHCRCISDTIQLVLWKIYKKYQGSGPSSASEPFHSVEQQTHTHPFNSPFSGTTRVSWYQKGKTNLDFTEARDSEWQWHQLGHMQVCTLLQTDNHAHHSVFTGRMPFLSPNQQRQSTVEQQSGTNSLVTFALHFLSTLITKLKSGLL